MVGARKYSAKRNTEEEDDDMEEKKKRVNAMVFFSPFNNKS